MYTRSAAAAWAIAEYEARKNAEHGTGYALIDEKGAFFCGFRQNDGQLAFGRYRQNGQGFTRVHDTSYPKDTPVFLPLAVMEACNVNAAVFGTEYAANCHHSLPPDLQQIVRRVAVRKDVDYHAPLPLADTPPPLSQPGLASPAACRAGQIDGYVNLKTALAEGAKQLWGALRF